ncbi:MAG: glycosyltransferase [Deltaproteobacteria bacterium]|nr:glycosyltransferase [Deltaproteobacteria bacterium]
MKRDGTGKVRVEEENVSESTACERFRAERVAYWNGVALRRWQGIGGYYHRRLAEIFRFLIPPGQRVLEIGCGAGDLLAAVSPAVGVGIDFSEEMVKRASRRHPGLRFVHADAHSFCLGETFDAIILSDLVHDLWDVQAVFERAARHSTPRTRIIINSYSRLWELPLEAAKRLGLARPLVSQNWLTVQDVSHILHLTDFEVVRTWSEILWPFWLPLIAGFLNKVFVRFWPFSQLAMTNFVVARPAPRSDGAKVVPSVSVIVPARNEAGNIPAIFKRVPEMGSGTEIVFVEGGSTDGTFSSIEGEMARNPGRRSVLLRQEGTGKGDAVRLGFSRAKGDVLMVLDADLTVPPEDLPRFYEALDSGKGDLINGVRLVYPMEKQAMRFFNLLANKGFSLAFWWLLGQPVKDTLCGTKVLKRTDYERIAANRAYFGDFDPFGDFDLLFGAARLGMRIVDLPVRYRERVYGTTNIERWRHGWLLLKMVLFACRRLKFV